MPTTVMLRDLSARFGCAVQAFRERPTPRSLQHLQDSRHAMAGTGVLDTHVAGGVDRGAATPTPTPTPTPPAINLYPARQS